jgi:hypothetical protein
VARLNRANFAVLEKAIVVVLNINFILISLLVLCRERSLSKGYIGNPVIKSRQSVVATLHNQTPHYLATIRRVNGASLDSSSPYLTLSNLFFKQQYVLNYYSGESN